VGSLIILVAMFALLWVLLIRPQRVRQQKQQQLISAVEAGDEILTVGGLYGIVQEMDEDDDLIVEVAEGIHVRIARRAVASVVKPEELEANEGYDGADDMEEAGDDVIEGEAELEAEERGLVTVPDEEAGLEATRRRLFGKRR
jgi:preprotein translocase subunit YajC